MTTPAKRPKRVRIYPVPGVSLYPWRPVEQEVTEEDWAFLRTARPAPFTDKPPEPVEKAAPEGGNT